MACLVRRRPHSPNTSAPAPPVNSPLAIAHICTSNPTTRPSVHDLVEALGEPRLADPGVPWAYNRLTFEVARDRDRVEVTVSPGYGEVLIGWQRDGEVLVTLQLGDVAALAVEREHEREYLV